MLDGAGEAGGGELAVNLAVAEGARQVGEAPDGEPVAGPDDERSDRQRDEPERHRATRRNPGGAGRPQHREDRERDGREERERAELGRRRDADGKAEPRGAPRRGRFEQAAPHEQREEERGDERNVGRRKAGVGHDRGQRGDDAGRDERDDRVLLAAREEPRERERREENARFADARASVTLRT